MSAYTGTERTPHASLSGPIEQKKEAEGDSFLDHVTTTDKTWCHNYEPKSLQQSMEWQVAPCEFPIKENVQDATLSAYSDVHCPLQQERGDPSGFPGTQTTHQLWLLYHDTMLNVWTLRRRQPFSCNTIVSGHVPVWRVWGTLSWQAFLPHQLCSPDLVPSDFHLFWLMKSNNAILAAVKQWVTSILQASCSLLAKMHS